MHNSSKKGPDQSNFSSQSEMYARKISIIHNIGWNLIQLHDYGQYLWTWSVCITWLIYSDLYNERVSYLKLHNQWIGYPGEKEYWNLNQWMELAFN